MAKQERNFTAFTGLTNFSYGVLEGNKIKGEEATDVTFLQEIAVATEQELVKAYGDNVIAEMAVSTGSTTLNTTFHTLPIQDRALLYGMIEKTGVYAMPGNPNPPYVACMFSKTREDGSMEHIGFTKGKFTIADQEAVTKGETIDFGKGTAEGEFMARKLEGFDKEISFIVAEDKPGETTARNEVYEAIYGVPHKEAVV